MANAVFLHALVTLSWLGGRQDSHFEDVDNHLDNGDCLLARGFSVFPRGLIIFFTLRIKNVAFASVRFLSPKYCTSGRTCSNPMKHNVFFV